MIDRVEGGRFRLAIRRGPDELLGRDLLERREHRDHGVVHPDVDGTERLLDTASGLLDLIGGRDVRRDGQGESARGLHLLRRRLKSLAPPGEQGYLCPVSAEGLGSGTPDTGARPGHHDDLAGDVHPSAQYPRRGVSIDWSREGLART